MVRSTSRRFLLSIALLLLGACVGEQRAPAAPVLVAPSEAAAQKFAEDFLAAVSRQDVETASAMIDWDVILGRATAGLRSSRRFHAGFMSGARDAAKRSPFITQLAKKVSEGAVMTLLRIRGDEGGRSALFRIIHKDGAVTYDEILLTGGAGTVRGADIYAYSGGEYVSEMMRRMYKFAAAKESAESDLVEAAKKYQEMMEKVLAGEHQAAADLFKQMPPELRKEKSVLVAYVSASSNLGEAQYQAAIDELHNAFPNDASIELMLVDGYILRGRYDDALSAIDRIEKDLNGDPYLDVLRRGVYMIERDFSAAERYRQRAIEREPELASMMP